MTQEVGDSIQNMEKEILIGMLSLKKLAFYNSTQGNDDE